MCIGFTVLPLNLLLHPARQLGSWTDGVAHYQIEESEKERDYSRSLIGGFSSAPQLLLLSKRQAGVREGDGSFAIVSWIKMGDQLGQITRCLIFYRCLSSVHVSHNTIDVITSSTPSGAFLCRLDWLSFSFFRLQTTTDPIGSKMSTDYPKLKTNQKTHTHAQTDKTSHASTHFDSIFWCVIRANILYDRHSCPVVFTRKVDETA